MSLAGYALALGEGGISFDVVTDGTSKSMSLNTGPDIVSNGLSGYCTLLYSSSGVLMSKSVGSGNSPGCAAFCSGVCGVDAGGNGVACLLVVVAGDNDCRALARSRANKNGARNSPGNPCGSSAGGVFSVAVGGVATTGGAAACGVSAGVGVINAGSDIVISGFFVRIITVIVAIYNGSAAKINMPNTKPPKPRSCARISRIQSLCENMSKLNMPDSIAHMMAT